MRRERIAFSSILGVYKKSYYLSHPWKLWWEIRTECRAFIERGLYGWSPRDTWGLDMYLAKVISESIEHIDHGIPGSFIGKAFEQLREEGNSEIPEEDDWGNIPPVVEERAQNIYQKVIKDISWAFQEYIDAQNDIKNYKEEAKRIEKAKELMPLFIEHLETFWN